MGSRAIVRLVSVLVAYDPPKRTIFAGSAAGGARTHKLFRAARFERAPFANLGTAADTPILGALTGSGGARRRRRHTTLSPPCGPSTGSRPSSEGASRHAGRGTSRPSRRRAHPTPPAA